jgi:hypothetical protein
MSKPRIRGRRATMLDWRIPYLATCMYLAACEAAWAGWMMAWEPGRGR